MEAICFDSPMNFTDTYFVGDLSKGDSENIFSPGSKQIHLSKSSICLTLIFPITARGLLRAKSDI